MSVLAVEDLRNRNFCGTPQEGHRVSHTFKSGTIASGIWSDRGGGNITVEQAAYLFALGNNLYLNDGPWSLRIDGGVLNEGGAGTDAIRLPAAISAKNS